MNPVDLIRRKRDGGQLSREEIEYLVMGFVPGSVRKYHMAAFLMAVCFRGMNQEETAALTDVMLASGDVIDLSDIPGPKVDKHSTGGVGDKVSLILAPMVATCGVRVPMISGRGLGHTGGTLDKLESIPGFRTALSVKEYREIVRDVGVVMMGQTDHVAPADKKMYALRDVTATVESIPLIAGSIMSKKLAEGIDGLVLDVKSGNGAFMRTYDEAVELAETLVSTGSRLGKRTMGFITDMNQPLGATVGNWLEVVEVVECLRGKNVPDLMEVCYVLGGAMLHIGGVVGSIADGMKQCQSAVWSGRAYEKFLEVVRRQGGDTSVLERPSSYPGKSVSMEILSVRDGFVIGFDTQQIGLCSSELGAGRRAVDDQIDPMAGIEFRKKIGDAVRSGEVLAVVHSGRRTNLEDIADRIAACIRVGDNAPSTNPRRVLSVVEEGGTRAWEEPVVF
ncbi:MAG: thymidine phosphorylase [Ignavibacteria bacterium]|nr:thymidine phosphorylase [Ignavibacteria bacterium]